MLKKHSIKKKKNNINFIIGRNSYTDYNNKNNQYSLKEKITSINNNNILHSLFESPIQTKNSLYLDSNNFFGLSYQTQTNTQTRIFSSPVLNSTNSTEFTNIKFKNTKQLLKKLRKTILRIKKKNIQRLNDLEYSNNSKIKKNYSVKNKLKNKSHKNDSPPKFSKTLPKFNFAKNKLNLDEIEKNKNKYKELRFKVHNTIKSNIHPLCNNYINKAHLFNEKILEYYQSDHFINLIRNFHKKLHFKLNLENHPKIKMYTDIKSLEKVNKTNKLDFRKCFSEKEQNLILLDPAYYFQKDNPDSFINVNITKKKSLADRIKEEDEEQQIKQILNNFINKKNKRKTRNIKIGFDYTDSKRKLISKVNKIINYNKKNNINKKNLDYLEINSLPTNDNNEEINEFKNAEKYDFFKAYKTYVKEAYENASYLNKKEEKQNNKKNKFKFNIDNKLKNCIINLHYIYKDKALQKRAKEKLYYDKAKDEKNKFNIVTKQMLVEQNYEYLNKFNRKIIRINKNDKNENIKTNGDRPKNKDENIKDKKEKVEDDKTNSNDKEKEKDNIIDMADNREKKLINLHINKIKLIYKQK